MVRSVVIRAVMRALPMVFGIQMITAGNVVEAGRFLETNEELFFAEEKRNSLDDSGKLNLTRIEWAGKTAVYGVAAGRRSGKWIYRKFSGKRMRYAYRYADGSYPRGIVKLKGGVYYFSGITGELHRGYRKLVYQNGDGYYISENGKALSGWHQIGIQRYYFDKKTKKLRKDGSKQKAAKQSNVEKGAAQAARNSGTAQATRDGQAGQKRSGDSLRDTCSRILSSITNKKMSKSQKLQAVYRYVASRNHFSYSTRHYPELNSSTWIRDLAKFMFSEKAGNCYGFSSAFAALAYEVGYDPVVCVGRVPGRRDGARDGYTRHAMVQIDGLYYDPEAQCAGWHPGIYGLQQYPVSFQAQGSYRYRDQIQAAASTGGGSAATAGSSAASSGGAGQVSCTVKKQEGYYVGYQNGKQISAGTYLIHGKLYKFDRDGKMQVSLFQKLEAAAKPGMPFRELQKMIGKPERTQTMGESCFDAENGVDVVRRYRHFSVYTFVPANGGEELVEDIAE